MEKSGIKPVVIQEIRELAVSGGDFNKFALDLEETTSTLLKYDVVNLNADVQKTLLDSIQKEGKILYEKI